MNTDQSITLLIPAFNAESSIGDLLNDAIHQTVPFGEIIVFNDCSTDQTSSICKAAGVKIIDADKNSGVSFARQKLLMESTCHYIHFHDADDRMDRNYVKKMQLLCSTGRVVVCDMNEFLQNGKVRKRTHKELSSSVDIIDYVIDNFIHLNAMVLDREIARIAGFDESFRTNGDRLFLYSVAAQIPEFIHLPDVLCSRCVNDTSLLARTSNNVIIQNFIRAAEIAIDLFPVKNHLTIGKYCLFYAWKEFTQGNDAMASECLRVARLCGVRHIPDQGWKLRLTSRILGIHQTMKLRRLWFNLH